MDSEITALIQEAARAFRSDDADRVRGLLDGHPELRAMINEPAGPFDSPPILNVRSRAMLDVLLDAGADINARSRWWAGGFGLLDSAKPELAAYAIERGAIVDVHAAARLGRMDRLRELIAADPALVHARGGDGQTPLHFASGIEAADYLLDRGADIDARDVDHESTPAQWMLDSRQDVARHLVSRGCRTDLLMAAALGDRDLVRRHLDADPDCVRMRVGSDYFPMANPRAGGTICQWTLGFHVSAHDVARKSGHADVLQLLLERSPADVKLLDACWTGDEETARTMSANHPAVAADLPERDRRQVAHAARNNNTAAVRLMLECGLSVAARGQHQATPLHWAAFHGNADLIEIILGHNPPLEVTDADFGGTPLRWAIYGSEHGWYCESGDYAASVEALIRAGAKRPTEVTGTPVVQDVLRRYASHDDSADNQ